MAAPCLTGIDTGFVILGYAKVAILGVVQGITELLPISSTAHMRIVPALLGWRDPGSAFSAAMQLAALAAVISYFWQDVRRLAVGSVSAPPNAPPSVASVSLSALSSPSRMVRDSAASTSRSSVAAASSGSAAGS